MAFTAHYNGPRYFSELGDLDQFYCVILLVLVSCGPNATVNFWTRKMSGLLSLVLVSTVFFQTMLISHPSSGRFLVTFARPRPNCLQPFCSAWGDDFWKPNETRPSEQFACTLDGRLGSTGCHHDCATCCPIIQTHPLKQRYQNLIKVE